MRASPLESLGPNSAVTRALQFASVVLVVEVVVVEVVVDVGTKVEVVVVVGGRVLLYDGLTFQLEAERALKLWVSNAGVVDARVAAPQVEYISTEGPSARVAETERFNAYAVRWPVFEGVFQAAVLLLEGGVATSKQIDAVQQKALGMVQVSPEEKAAAARKRWGKGDEKQDDATEKPGQGDPEISKKNLQNSD